MMRIALALLLALHGIAHGVGFAATWRLGEFRDRAPDTTILAGRADIGPAGARAMGVAWLLTGLAFVVSAVATGRGLAWWPGFTAGTAAVSLALSVLGWPASRIGVAVNLAILAVVLFADRLPLG